MSPLKSRLRKWVRRWIIHNVNSRVRWERTQDAHEVFAELKRKALHMVVPYGIGTAVWKSVSSKLSSLLPEAVWKGLSKGINTYAIPIAGVAIGVYIAWRGWVTYRLIKKLRQCQSSDT